MILYHICSKENFAQKLSYAEASGGKLLLTPHSADRDTANGYFPAYLHCLPNIVGAVPFAGERESIVIRIELSPAAKIAKYHGEQDAIDFSSFGRDSDLIHTVFESGKSFRWQEILLVSNKRIAHWTSDLSILANDFQAQIELLELGELSPEGFFYRDFTVSEQTQIARLVGHYVGVSSLSDEEVGKAREAFRSAYRRVEAHYLTQARATLSRPPRY